jgi:hypothetical protein
MTRYAIQRGKRQVPGETQSAGLVLGHSVHVAAVAGQAHRGTVAALDPDVEVRLDRAAWSDAFRVGDRVRATHTGRCFLTSASARRDCAPPNTRCGP